MPANVTSILRALLPLEGIAILIDPGVGFIETAKPYAKEFMLRREGKELRNLIFNKITGRENGTTRIEWPKVWKLTKMAASMYLQR